MPSVPELDIRKHLEHLREPLPHPLRPDVARAAHLRPRRRLEHTIIRHERHQVIDIMPIPPIPKRFQILHRHHDDPSSSSTFDANEACVKPHFKVSFVWWSRANDDHLYSAE